MNETVSFFPINARALDKGDVVVASTIERVTNTTRGTDDYNLGMLQVRNYILSQKRAMGEHVTVKCEKHDLRILTDEEDIGYQDKNFDAGGRKMRNALKSSLAIDRANISLESNEQLNQNICKQSMVVRFMRKGIKEYQALPEPLKDPKLTKTTEKKDAAASPAELARRAVLVEKPKK